MPEGMVEKVRNLLCATFEEHPISYTAGTIVVMALLAWI